MKLHKKTLLTHSQPSVNAVKCYKVSCLNLLSGGLLIRFIRDREPFPFSVRKAPLCSNGRNWTQYNDLFCVSVVQRMENTLELPIYRYKLNIEPSYIGDGKTIKLKKIPRSEDRGIFFSITANFVLLIQKRNLRKPKGEQRGQ